MRLTGQLPAARGLPPNALPRPALNPALQGQLWFEDPYARSLSVACRPTADDDAAAAPAQQPPPPVAGGSASPLRSLGYALAQCLALQAPSSMSLFSNSDDTVKALIGLPPASVKLTRVRLSGGREVLNASASAAERRRALLASAGLLQVPTGVPFDLEVQLVNGLGQYVTGALAQSCAHSCGQATAARHASRIDCQAGLSDLRGPGIRTGNGNRMLSAPARVCICPTIDLLSPQHGPRRTKPCVRQ